MTDYAVFPGAYAPLTEDPPRSGPAGTWTMFVVACSVAAGVVVALATFLLVASGSPIASIVGDLGFTVSSAVAAAACFRASRRQPSKAKGWRLIGVAAGLYTGGALVWTYYGITRGQAYPFPSAADLGFLGYLLPALLGLVSFPMDGVRGVSLLRSVLDGVLIASAVFFVSWGTVLGSSFWLPSTGVLAYAVGLAHPVVDLTMAAVVLALYMRRAPGHRLPFGLVAGGFLVLALTDSIHVGRTLAGLLSTGTILGAGWTICWLMVALATLAPTAGREGPSAQLGSLQEMLPYLPVVAALVVVGASDAPLRSDPVLLAAGFIVVVAVAVRQVVLTREHAALASERRTVEDQMRHQAFHDPLTGLSNRRLFKDRLAQALARSSRSRAEVAVMFLDLDDFKEINDGLGHAAGDAVLLGVAARLRQAVRAGETVARFGGDEFAVLVEDFGDSDQLDRVAERIVATVALPIVIEHMAVTVRASVGIAVATRTSSVDELLRNADLAMYVAKDRRKGGYVRFASEMHAVAMARVEMAADLRVALAEDQFVVFYQPKIELPSGRIVGYEALVRWIHPTKGLIAPSDFIPLAEETGIINAIGEQVMRKACGAVARWQGEAGGEGLTVAVNLSGRQLMDVDVVGMVASALAEHRLPGSLLELEITETTLMEDVHNVVPVLGALRRLGVTVTIDDFGTGYSSLSYLRELPVNCLKIDRAFVAGLGRNEQDSALVAAVIAVAKALGMTSVAEGVETFEQLVELEALGCNCVQGYYLGMPEVGGWKPSLGEDADPARVVGLVLVCDDDEVTRRVNRKAFEIAGAQVVEAADGVECLAQARAARPDLIVLDLRMPLLDGMSALPLLRKACPSAKVIIVSSTTGAEMVEQGLRIGATAFFDKVGFVARIPAVLAEFGRIPEPTAVV